MAYGQNTQASNGNNQASAASNKSSYSAPRAQAAKSATTFEKDPNEVGIAYLKTSEKVGSYFSVSITADIPAGAKLVIFENKVKNRTDKTPTHVIKLAAGKKAN